MNAREHDSPPVTLEFELVGIQTKFSPGVTFPIVILRSVPTPKVSYTDFGELSLAPQDWLNERISIIQMLERN